MTPQSGKMPLVMQLSKIKFQAGRILFLSGVFLHTNTERGGSRSKLKSGAIHL
jgi:hypothetical protein